MDLRRALPSRRPGGGGALLLGLLGLLGCHRAALVGAGAAPEPVTTPLWAGPPAAEGRVPAETAAAPEPAAAEAAPASLRGPFPELRTEAAPLAIFPAAQPVPYGARVTCPVCGDEFTVEPSTPVRRHRGKMLLFCCERCLPHFHKNPDLFLNQ